MIEVHAGTTIPLVAGESLYGIGEFTSLLDSRAAAIINPDVCNTGGILELMDIAAAARARLIGVAPHNFNSPTVGLAASLHCALAMPNLIILEYFSNWREVALTICPNAPVPENGFIVAPTAPGLGVDLDINALESLGSEEAVPIRLPDVAEETGGS
jgi:galactonate dehydratase